MGLVTGVCFSNTSNKVICLDIDKNKESGSYVKEGKIENWNYFMKIPAHLVEKAVNEKLLWETLFLYTNKHESEFEENLDLSN